jgi:hypothetical protein
MSVSSTKTTFGWKSLRSYEELLKQYSTTNLFCTPLGLLIQKEITWDYGGVHYLPTRSIKTSMMIEAVAGAEFYFIPAPSSSEKYAEGWRSR